MTHGLGKLWSDEGAGKSQLEGDPAGGYCPQLVQLQECSGTCRMFSSEMVEKIGFSSWTAGFRPCLHGNAVVVGWQ